MTSGKAISLLVLACLMVYANSLTKTFVLDDDHWIVGNEDINRPGDYFRSLPGRPLLAASNLLLHRVGRDNPLPHRLFNITVHLLAGLTLFGLVRRCLELPRFGDRFQYCSNEIAFASALLWLVHPLQVQSVTYIIQRGESMAGLFYLLNHYALLRMSQANRYRFWWGLLATIACVLGFASKETMVTAGISLILFDRAVLARSWREMIRERWAFYLLYLGAWGGLLAWNLIRAFGSAAEGGVGFGVESVTPKTYLFTQAGVLVYYLRLCFWPTGTAIDYQGWPWTTTLSATMPEGALIGGILLLTLILLVVRPALGFILAWFFIVLAPTSSFLPIVDPVFEHRMYLSLATVTTLIALAVERLSRDRRMFVVGVAIALSIPLGWRSYQRNEEYVSRSNVWRVALDRMPESGRARVSLGQGLIVEGRPDEAIPYLRLALDQSGRDPVALQNIIVAYQDIGDYLSAAHYARMLRSHYPKNGLYARFHGTALLATGQYTEAESTFREAIELSPENLDGYAGWAAALIELGQDPAEAIAKATTITADWPSTPVLSARALILDAKQRKHPEAVRLARTWARLAVAGRPRPEAKDRDTLALCHAANGDFEAAAAQCRLALNESPSVEWAQVHRLRLRFYEARMVPWGE